MKVGDIVRWTKTDHHDVGVVVEVLKDRPGLVHVMWTHPYEYAGFYPYDTQFLELVDEDQDKRD